MATRTEPDTVDEPAEQEQDDREVGEDVPYDGGLTRLGLPGTESNEE
jgi:hypothetical protein